jgi:hypothetical protein
MNLRVYETSVPAHAIARPKFSFSHASALALQPAVAALAARAGRRERLADSIVINSAHYKRSPHPLPT